MAPNVMLRGRADFTDPKEADRLNAEMALAKSMAEELQRLYPKHQWATRVDARQGLAMVKIPALMADPTLWYSIRLSEITGENEMVKALREAGGHILERFRLHRGTFRLVDFQEALATRRIIGKKTPMPE